MFDSVDPKQSLPDLERGILRYWQEEDIFQRSLRLRSLPKGDPLDGPRGSKEEVFSFYDGPPFATGLPHYGHLLAGTIKDVIPRYQTMRGKYVQRRFGWDCHGLPVEYEIEKEHGINSRLDIEKMGTKAFNDLCRKAVQRFTKEWRVTVERMGRFVDMDWDYRTMDAPYMESIWWAFNELHEKGLIYEGHKPMHICPRCQTPLSNFEVTQGYKDVTDQTVTAKFEILPSPGHGGGVGGGSEKTYILAWTTTPWTLPGNLFLAVGSKIRYVLVRSEDAEYIVAKDLHEKIFKGRPFEVLKELRGDELTGLHYKPLFPYFEKEYKDRSFRVVAADFVTTEDGTGVVHIAPGFGEDDYAVGLQEGINPPLQHVGMDGKFTSEVTDFAGADVKPKDDPSKMDKKIAQYLEQHGGLFAKESFTHSYPHCWRCDSPLLNYATSSWFVAVEKIKKDMLAVNTQTEWVPAHLRDGRFGKWLEGARDWAISRNRYWGTPLPIWRCKETKELEVIGSRQEMMDHVPYRLTRVTILRHGESQGNVTPVYQGKEPGTDLTDRGRKQATATGEFLASENVAVIYASPLKRTQQTARVIAEHTGAEIATDERIREVVFGEYEGKSIDFSDLAFVKARRAHKLENNQIESIYHFPGMEKWAEVSKRTAAFLHEVLPMHRGEHIVIVTHADPLLTMRHFFEKEDPAKLTKQPYPDFARPLTFYWDHETEMPLDLHKETVDTIAWEGSPCKQSVEILLVRHGETDWNRDKKIQGGEINEPLNAKGKEQAHTLAKELKGQKFDVLISSDLIRAKETAEILSKELGIPYRDQWDLLQERHCGEWTKITKAQFYEQTGWPKEGGISVYPGTPENGESLTQFLDRIDRARRKLLSEFPGKRVLVVAHGGTMEALSVLVNHTSIKKTKCPENCGTLTFTLHPLLQRIPEVLDCWFESGSMPYAQSHFPFERLAGSGKRLDGRKTGSLVANRYSLPAGFPADFIAEGIDQTRGWFYTLIVLSAALFKKPAFVHCIVNGTVLAADGKKMSKRLKNYPEPLEIVEKHGADAVRFALMSSPAVRAEDLRFSDTLVEETVRSVLLPLWNTYSFFVTYANTAGWQPSASRESSKHPLDQWIRAEVQDLVNRMTEQLEGYDLSATCDELHETIDALTNWYVRLSRRRFAGKSAVYGVTASEVLESDAHTEQQQDALQTLHEVLLTLSQLLAPFCPFITDAIYLNLTSAPHSSIHITDWPEVRKLKKGETQLLTTTRMLRTIVSLGLRIRAEKKIRVRQPLPKVIIALPKSLRDSIKISAADTSLLQEELNVKNVEFADDPGSLAETIALVDARKVGPRLGGRVQELIQAGKRGDFAQQEDGSVLVLDETLSPDEVSIVYRGKEGADVAADHGIVVSLDTAVTQELQKEGDARELIRAIQQLRKDAGFSIDQKVTVSIDGADDLVQIHGPMITNETNTVLGKAKGEAHEVQLEDKTVTIHLAHS